MAGIKGKTPKLMDNLDQLFELNNGVNPLETSVPIIETQAHHKRVITSILINKLTPYKGHPFKLYEGERLDDMIESIRTNGILVPIIARRIGEITEILAGHNRANAAKLAGLDEVPALILENISDEDAQAYVIETNLIQRSFSDMTHTEKAAVIALHHSKMFSQGKRNDIIEQIKMLENPHEHGKNETFPPLGEKLNSAKQVGEMYSLSKNTVSRYIRIQFLIPKLKKLPDDETVAFRAAVTLSFLCETEQALINDCIERNGLTVDMKKAELLRQFSEKGKLDGENVYKILSGNAAPKPNRTPTVKIDKNVYAQYFKPNQPAKEVQATVEKALEMYFA